MWSFMVDFVENNLMLSVFLGVSLALLTVAAIARAVSQNNSAYVGTVAILAGGFMFLYLQGDVRLDKNLSLAVAVALTYGGTAYLLCGFIGWAVRKRRESRSCKGEICNLQYALPVRGNDYVRARLHAITNANDEICTSQARESLPTELAYARELLAKVREKELSATDILQTEELGKLFALYGKKEGFSYADVRTVNEGFCCLLKLAAKYSVEP